MEFDGVVLIVDIALPTTQYLQLNTTPQTSVLVAKCWSHDNEEWQASGYPEDVFGLSLIVT